MNFSKGNVFQVKELTRILKLVFLSLFVTGSIVAQVTRITGKVKDKLTNEPIPFASVVFKGTTIGATANINGEFKIETERPTDTLVATFLGYKSVALKIRKGQEQVVNFALPASKVELKEVVINAGENPANIIFRKIQEHKEQNNAINLDYYHFEVYNKLEFDLTNISDKFKNRKLFKPFKFIFDKIDSSITNEKPSLPFFISESLSDRYFKNSPKDKKEIIRASKISGVENATVTQFLGDMYQNMNIYDNFIGLFGKSFVSPISGVGLLYYKYYLLDSTFIDNKWCYKMKFKPRRPQELTFTGEMWVHDTTFAIKKINMRIAPDANINFVEDLAVVKEYDFVDGQAWMLTKDLFVVDFLAKEDNLGFIGRKTTSYKNFQINQHIPDSIFGGTEEVDVKEDAKEHDDQFWFNARHDSLSVREKQIYAMVDTIKKVPAFKTYVDIITLIVTGYYDAGAIELGPYFTTYSFNSIEGNRFRIGGKTDNTFSVKLQLEGYAAYGTLDKEFKYGLGARYYFKTKPREGIGVYYKKDVLQLGQSENAFQDDNILGSLFRRNAADRLTGTTSEKIYYEKEWVSGFSSRLIYEHNEYVPLGKLDFSYYTDAEKSFVRNAINTSEISAYFRFAYREKFIYGKRGGRVSLGSKYPILQTIYTYGIKDFQKSDFAYHKLSFKISDRVKTPPFGYNYYIIEGGRTWGTVPFPLLEVHRGNESYFYDYLAFNLMNYYEFVSDQYISFFTTQHFDGFFLDKIPLFRKLKWREVATFKIVAGKLNEKNRNILVYPNEFYELSKPYMEGGFGVENIFKIFRIDFLYRFSYLNNPNIAKYGIRGSLQLTF